MIMNTKKQQAKQVTGVVQDVPPKEYIGLETDTAIVHVDADAKEISVDVLTHNLVDWSGEDANKGYPAPLGRDALVRADLALLSVRDEQSRAEEAERKLEFLIDETAEQISIGDGKVLLHVLAESERAQNAEDVLNNKIESTKNDLSNTIEETSDELQQEIYNTEESLNKQLQDVNIKVAKTKNELEQELVKTNSNIEATTNSLENSLIKTKEELSQSILDTNQKLDNKIEETNNSLLYKLDSAKQELQNDIDTTNSNLQDATDSLETLITQTSEELNNLITSSSKLLSDRIDNTTVYIDETRSTLETSISDVKVELVKNINDTAENLTQLIDLTDSHVDQVQSRVENIEYTYAPKLYVHEEILKSLQLSKQVIDSIDLENNLVIINGESSAPVDGFLYMLKDETNKGIDIYQEYTTIDGKLTLIGDTSISLEGYATETYVHAQIDAIPPVDISGKSDVGHKHKLSDVTDYVPTDLTGYATESWVEDKKYLTEHQSLDGKADKLHVHKLVDITDYKEPDLSDYAKKTDIPDVSSFIAEIPEEYVTDEELTAKGYYTQQDVTTLLTGIKFIDGGNAASMLK